MKLAHNITVKVFSKPEDDAVKIKGTLVSIFPFDLKENKIKINEHSATGFNERKIRIFEIRLGKGKLIKQFMENLRERLGKDSKKLADQAEARIDEELHFFLRLDKEILMKKNEFKLTDTGNCFHINISPAIYPKKREKAVELVRGFFA